LKGFGFIELLGDNSERSEAGNPNPAYKRQLLLLISIFIK